MFVSAVFVFFKMPHRNINYKLEYLTKIWANMDFNTIIMISFSLSCMVIFGLWYYKSCGGDLKPNFKKTFHPLQVAGIICLVPGTQFMSSILVGLISSVFPSWLEAYENLMETAGLTNNISIAMLLYSVFLAPISEELIFRGVTLRIAQRAFPFWIANMIQALLFGFFHMNMLQGCYAFALGLFLGYICEYGGTIYHVFLFHFLFNLWGTTASEWFSFINPAFGGIIILLGTTLGLGFGIKLFQKGTPQN